MAENVTIYDAWGEPIARPRPETLTARSIPDSIRDRGSLGSILTNITPGRIKAAFAEADSGMLGRQIELARDILERDGHLRSVWQIRHLQVTGLQWQITPGDESEDSQDACEAAKAWWERLDWRGLLGRLLEAVICQWAVEQILWDTGGGERGGERERGREGERGSARDGETEGEEDKQKLAARRQAALIARLAASGWTPRASEAVDARRLVWPMNDGGEPVVRPALMGSTWSPTDTTPLLPGKYVTHQYATERGRPGKGALIRCLAALWAIKWYALVDWSTLVEKFGSPWTIVKYVPGMSDREIDELIARLAAAAAERVIAVPSTAAVETTQGTSHTASAPQGELIKFIEDTQSKVLIGSTTITDAAGEGSDSVSSPTHAAVRKLIRDADAVGLAASVNRDLLTPWFVWNRSLFGPAARAPQLTPTLGEPPDPTKRATIYESAGRLNLRVKSDQLYREYGLEKPDDVEEVIELRSTAPAGPFGAGDFMGQFSRPGAGREGEGGSGRGGEGGTEGRRDGAAESN